MSPSCAKNGGTTLSHAGPVAGERQPPDRRQVPRAHLDGGPDALDPARPEHALGPRDVRGRAAGAGVREPQRLLVELAVPRLERLRGRGRAVGPPPPRGTSRGRRAAAAARCRASGARRPRSRTPPGPRPRPARCPATTASRPRPRAAGRAPRRRGPHRTSSARRGGVSAPWRGYRHPRKRTLDDTTETSPAVELREITDRGRLGCGHGPRPGPGTGPPHQPDRRHPPRGPPRSRARCRTRGPSTTPSPALSSAS